MLSARAVLLLRDGLGRRASGHDGADADLLALRALAFGSPRRLARAVPDAASGWRRGDPHVLARLAELELGRLGLRGPTLVRGPDVAVASAPAPDEPDIGWDTDAGTRPGALPRVDPDEGWGDTPPPPGPSGPHTS
jgi:hypothetical protein